ncbi:MULTISPECIES: sensor histidine kinase [Gracilimonas]|uniref:histidine kinase n=1 Tax=Gracilimonas sediminicola TaxID=2952158 RepID=A0A9X2RFC8_9BACT|nr:histidine kinase dimerization/phosphoacceptor domain -containing protein [Gracilimonas sediminicola]MCP9290294.1 response regulator [Gracilimonas sediminicola]
MTKKKGFFRVLLVEDNESHAELIEEKISTLQEDIVVTKTDNRDDLIAIVRNDETDLVLCDYYLPGYSGLEVLSVVREINQELPFILITGYLPEKLAVEAMRDGASDYIMKDNADRLLPAIVRELRNYSRLKESQRVLAKNQKTIDRAYQLAAIGHWEYDVKQDKRFWSDTVKSIHRVDDSFDPNAETTFPFIRDDHDRDLLLNALNESIENGTPYETELEVQTPDGEHRWVRIMWESEMENGECIRILGSVQDIHGEKLRKEKLQEALKEKNTLLNEIHHRVKNNLAVISGMLHLQAFGENDERLQSKLFDSVSRINSMAAVHEILYKSETFSRLDFSESINKLVSSITSVFQSDTELNVHLNIDKNLELNINQAIPLSLTINEVITNTIKHAYGKDESGDLYISLTNEGDKIQLVIEDYGKGIPDGFEPDDNTLGFNLIGALTEQLEGIFSYKGTGKGTKFELCFSKSEKKGSSNALI